MEFSRIIIQDIQAYEQKFDQRISGPCYTFDKIMGSSLAEFYMYTTFGQMTYKDVENGDKDELEMLLGQANQTKQN